MFLIKSGQRLMKDDIFIQKAVKLNSEPWRRVPSLVLYSRNGNIFSSEFLLKARSLLIRSKGTHVHITIESVCS